MRTDKLRALPLSLHGVTCARAVSNLHARCLACLASSSVIYAEASLSPFFEDDAGSFFPRGGKRALRFMLRWMNITLRELTLLSFSLFVPRVIAKQLCKKPRSELSTPCFSEQLPGEVRKRLKCTV
jgi:hypothetical protein